MAEGQSRTSEIALRSSGIHADAQSLFGHKRRPYPLVRLPFESCHNPDAVAILQYTCGSHFAVREANYCPPNQLNTAINNELYRFVRNQSNRAIVISVVKIDRDCIASDDVGFLI